MAVGSEEYVIKRSDNYRYFLLSIVIAVGIVAVVLTFIMMIGTRKVFGVELGVPGWRRSRDPRTARPHCARR